MQILMKNIIYLSKKHKNPLKYKRTWEIEEKTLIEEGHDSDTQNEQLVKNILVKVLLLNIFLVFLLQN